MARSLDYFFTLSSPWSYLGHDLMRRIADSHGVAVAYRPMPIFDVFDQTGTLPLSKRPPARLRYRLVEMQRWREKRGLKLNLKPAFFPFNADPSNRAVIALVLTGHDPHRFAALAYESTWVHEQDLADETVIAALLAEAGHDPDAILAAAGSDAVSAAYAKNGDYAVAADVFGAPGYVLDGEVFWGQDRLELLEDALTSGRAAYNPV